MDVCSSLLKLTDAVALSRPREQKGLCVLAAPNCRDSHQRRRESHTAGDSATHPDAFHTRTGIGKMRGCEAGNQCPCHTKRSNAFFALDQHTAETSEREREREQFTSSRGTGPAVSKQAARRCSAQNYVARTAGRVAVRDPLPCRDCVAGEPSL
jgi:hypothetical protein